MLLNAFRSVSGQILLCNRLKAKRADQYARTPLQEQLFVAGECENIHYQTKVVYYFA